MTKFGLLTYLQPWTPTTNNNMTFVLVICNACIRQLYLLPKIFKFYAVFSEIQFFFFLSCAFEGFNYQNLELCDYNLNDFLDEKYLQLELAEEEDKEGQKKQKNLHETWKNKKEKVLIELIHVDVIGSVNYQNLLKVCLYI